MPYRLRISCIFFFIPLALFCSSCANQKETVLRVGVTPNYPPLIFKDQGNYEGLEKEMAERLAYELGKDLKYVELAWKDQIPALLNKKIDIIMSGMSITPERESMISFSDPYLRICQMALIRKDDLAKYNSKTAIQSIQGAVGVEKDTTSELVVGRDFTSATVVAYTEKEKAMSDLINGKIEAYVHDVPEIWWLSGEYEKDNLVPARFALNIELLAWGIRKEDVQFRDSVNAILSSWKQSKKLDARILFWMPFFELLVEKNEELY
ncbi:MAG: transporter substrate-binding domain-containing protein [Candidatus Auribacterota bacterium]